jgi:hypothetical protein
MRNFVVGKVQLNNVDKPFQPMDRLHTSCDHRRGTGQEPRLYGHDVMIDYNRLSLVVSVSKGQTLADVACSFLYGPGSVHYSYLRCCSEHAGAEKLDHVEVALCLTPTNAMLKKAQCSDREITFMPLWHQATLYTVARSYLPAQARIACEVIALRSSTGAGCTLANDIYAAYETN